MYDEGCDGCISEGVFALRCMDCARRFVQQILDSKDGEDKDESD